jgi:hypothetical protein
MISTPRRALGLALAGCSALLLSSWLEPREVSATPPEPAPTTQPVAAADAGAQEASDPASTTVTVSFVTSPPVPAVVTWGKKFLGKIKPGRALVLVRPRDSGPLDVMVRAQGYLHVQTRAHTFSNNRVLVKLTPLENKSELLGYRAPLDAGIEPEHQAEVSAAADAGVAQVPGSFEAVPAPP